MIIARTPLRISFVGGGTDFPDYYQHIPIGGAVISCAISLYVYVVVKKRFDDKIHVGYSQSETVTHINDIKHDIVRECLRYMQVTSGIEVHIMADVPGTGSGLGSSSALTVGLLNALHYYKTGGYLNPDKMASLAFMIELLYLEKSIGAQDQYIAAFGDFQRFTFYSNTRVDGKLLTPGIDEVSLYKSVMLFSLDTGRKAENILSDQVAQIPINTSFLNLMRAQVDDFEIAIATNDIDEMANIMRDAWTYKRKLSSRISNHSIDSVIQDGMAAGALAGKVCGAGGGGHVVFLCLPEKQTAVRKQLSYLKQLDIELGVAGSTIIFKD